MIEYKREKTGNQDGMRLIASGTLPGLAEETCMIIERLAGQIEECSGKDSREYLMMVYTGVNYLLLKGGERTHERN